MFPGYPVSLGVGTGKIIFYKQDEIKINTRVIDVLEIDKEVVKLEVAICKTFIEIYDLHENFNGNTNDEEKNIADVYRAILDDAYFFEEMKETIHKKLCTVENAIDICIKRYINELEISDNEYAKQRTYDLNDIRIRLIKNVFGESTSNLENITSEHIVLVDELTPTLAIILGRIGVRGIAARVGGSYLSHASILLRSSGIPTINNVDIGEIEKFENQLAIINGTKGFLIIDPNNGEFEDARNKNNCTKKSTNDVSIKTLDSHQIGIFANISHMNDLNYVKTMNIDGVGLVRTETLFMNDEKCFNENRQYEVYTKIVKKMKLKPVTIRTVDVGGDKQSLCTLSRNQTPLHKSRGIKWLLNNPQDFKVQVRAILRAARHGNVRISFPMVENADEIREGRKIINNIIKEVCLTDNEFQKMRTGVLIETKNAVNNIDEILEEVDFISIGTNDLLQEILGFNRMSKEIGKDEFLNPKFLRTLDYCIQKIKKKKIFINVCGEMAADPFGSILLLGMGVNNLSMNPLAIPNISKVLREIHLEDCKRILKDALKIDETKAVKKIICKMLNNGA